ncbi:MAG: hypothetical protein Q8P32_03660 [Candidatus Komeilibacteria bacterium]|nr:hypothetical protein [Candidatus Komeilibacteria bacterium]
MVYRIPSGELLGNVDLLLIKSTMQGDAIWLINGPARAVGLDITNAENRSIYYFGEGYTGAGNNHPATGTTLPLNTRIYVRLVVYRTLPGGVIFFLQSIGQGFFDHLEDSWVEAVFEIEVFLNSDGTIQITGTGQNLRENYLEQFKQTSLRHQAQGLLFQ